MEPLRTVVARAGALRAEAHKILSVHEASRSRVVNLEETYQRLQVLNLRQDDLMKQAIRCLEHELFRAAHIMAWSAFMDFLEEKLESDGLAKVKKARGNWRGDTMAEIMEAAAPEYQVIEVARDVGLCNKTQMKALHGLLNKRNECAHPSDYYPLLNDTLGYVSELLNRIDALSKKSL